MPNPAAIVTAFLLADPTAGSGAAVDRIMADYHRKFPAVSREGCLPSSDPDEVVVCAKRNNASRERLPLPIEREEGARVNGEMATGPEVAKKFSPCNAVGPMPKCTGGAPVAGAVALLVKLVKKVVEGDD